LTWCYIMPILSLTTESRGGGGTLAYDLVPSPTSVYLVRTIVEALLLDHRIPLHLIVLDYTFHTSSVHLLGISSDSK
jgi:hypothetical protein